MPREHHLESQGKILAEIGENQLAMTLQQHISAIAASMPFAMHHKRGHGRAKNVPTTDMATSLVYLKEDIYIKLPQSFMATFPSIKYSESALFSTCNVASDICNRTMPHTYYASL